MDEETEAPLDNEESMHEDSNDDETHVARSSSSGGTT